MEEYIENAVTKLKKIIERNGLNYIKDEPYEVYLEILRDKKVDKKIANQILYFLVSDLSDLVEQNINSDSLLSLIQNKCDLNELAASNLVSIFQAIYSKENIKKLKNMKLKGLTLFLQENFVCEWKGLVRWQVGNIAVDCHYHAEITLMPKKNITEDDLLVWKLKNNPLMTKESIYDYFKHDICAYLDKAFKEYCTDEYYEPVAEDFDVEDNVMKWCDAKGFELINCKGEGENDVYWSQFGDIWS